MKKFLIFTLLFCVVAIWYVTKKENNQPASSPETGGEAPTKPQLEAKESVNLPSTSPSEPKESSPLETALREKVSAQIPASLKGRLQFNIQLTSKNRAKVYWRLDGRSVRGSDTRWVFDEQKKEWENSSALNWSSIKTQENFKTPPAAAVESAIQKEFSDSKVSGTIVKIGNPEWDLLQKKKLIAHVPVYVEINNAGRSTSFETWELSVPTLNVARKLTQGKHQNLKGALIRMRSEEP